MLAPMLDLCRLILAIASDLLRSRVALEAEILVLRACPRTSSGITEFSQHEADRGEAQESESLTIEVLPILGKSSTTVEPGDGAFNDPALWQYDECFGLIGAPHDFSFETRQQLCQVVVELRSLIGRIGKQLLQERMQPEHRGEQQDAAVAILDVGGMDDGVQQQTQRVYQNVALLALDFSATSSLSLLARIIAMRIDAGPPFSALFTLWLSMMAAVGLASRSSCSRHLT